MLGLSNLQLAYMSGAGAILSGLVAYHEPILAMANSDTPPLAGVERVENLSKFMVQSVKDSTSEVRAEIIGERLFMYRRNQCDALSDKEKVLALTIGEQIREMQSTYMSLTGLPYDLRPCTEY